MMEPTASQILPLFPPPGKTPTQSRRKFWSAVVDYAILLGLEGEILSAADHLAMHGRAYARPVEPVGPLPNVAALQKVFLYELDLYKTWRANYSTWRVAVIAAFGEEVLLAVQDPNGSLRNVTVPDMRARSDAAFQALPHDLRANRVVMQTVYNPSLLGYPEHCRRFQSAVLESVEFGGVIDPADLYNHFAAGLTPCRLFDAPIAMFENANPTAAAQTWEALSIALRPVAAKLNIEATTGSMGVAHIATASAVAASAINEELIARLIEAALSKRQPDKSRRQNVPKTTNWCWSCGKLKWRASSPNYLGHTSALCPKDRQKPGHRTEATESNKLGSSM